MKRGRSDTEPAAEGGRTAGFCALPQEIVATIMQLLPTMDDLRALLATATWFCDSYTKNRYQVLAALLPHESDCLDLPILMLSSAARDATMATQFVAYYKAAVTKCDALYCAYRERVPRPPPPVATDATSHRVVTGFLDDARNHNFQLGYCLKLVAMGVSGLGPHLESDVIHANRKTSAPSRFSQAQVMDAVRKPGSPFFARLVVPPAIARACVAHLAATMRNAVAKDDWLAALMLAEITHRTLIHQLHDAFYCFEMYPLPDAASSERLPEWYSDYINLLAFTPPGDMAVLAFLKKRVSAGPFQTRGLYPLIEYRKRRNRGMPACYHHNSRATMLARFRLQTSHTNTLRSLRNLATGLAALAPDLPLFATHDKHRLTPRSSTYGEDRNEFQRWLLHWGLWAALASDNAEAVTTLFAAVCALPPRGPERPRGAGDQVIDTPLPALYWPKPGYHALNHLYAQAAGPEARDACRPTLTAFLRGMGGTPLAAAAESNPALTRPPFAALAALIACHTRAGAASPFAAWDGWQYLAGATLQALGTHRADPAAAAFLQAVAHSQQLGRTAAAQGGGAGVPCLRPLVGTGTTEAMAPHHFFLTPAVADALKTFSKAVQPESWAAVVRADEHRSPSARETPVWYPAAAWQPRLVQACLAARPELGTPLTGSPPSGLRSRELAATLVQLARLGLCDHAMTRSEPRAAFLAPVTSTVVVATRHYGGPHLAPWVNSTKPLYVWCANPNIPGKKKRNHLFLHGRQDGRGGPPVYSYARAPVMPCVDARSLLEWLVCPHDGRGSLLTLEQLVHPAHTIEGLPNKRVDRLYDRLRPHVELPYVYRTMAPLSEPACAWDAMERVGRETSASLTACVSALLPPDSRLAPFSATGGLAWRVARLFATVLPATLETLLFRGLRVTHRGVVAPPVPGSFADALLGTTPAQRRTLHAYVRVLVVDLYAVLYAHVHTILERSHAETVALLLVDDAQVAALNRDATKAPDALFGPLTDVVQLLALEAAVNGADSLLFGGSDGALWASQLRVHAPGATQRALALLPRDKYKGPPSAAALARCIPLAMKAKPVPSYEGFHLHRYAARRAPLYPLWHRLVFGEDPVAMPLATTLTSLPGPTSEGKTRLRFALDALSDLLLGLVRASAVYQHDTEASAVCVMPPGFWTDDAVEGRVPALAVAAESLRATVYTLVASVEATGSSVLTRRQIGDLLRRLRAGVLTELAVVRAVAAGACLSTPAADPHGGWALHCVRDLALRDRASTNLENATWWPNHPFKDLPIPDIRVVPEWCVVHRAQLTGVLAEAVVLEQALTLLHEPPHKRLAMTASTTPVKALDLLWYPSPLLSPRAAQLKELRTFGTLDKFVLTDWPLYALVHDGLVASGTGTLPAPLLAHLRRLLAATPARERAWAATPLAAAMLHGLPRRQLGAAGDASTAARALEMLLVMDSAPVDDPLCVCGGGLVANLATKSRKFRRFMKFVRSLGTRTTTVASSQSPYETKKFTDGAHVELVDAYWLIVLLRHYGRQMRLADAVAPVDAGRTAAERVISVLADHQARHPHDARFLQLFVLGLALLFHDPNLRAQRTHADSMLALPTREAGDDNRGPDEAEAEPAPSFAYPVNAITELAFSETLDLDTTTLQLSVSVWLDPERTQEGVRVQTKTLREILDGHFEGYCRSAPPLDDLWTWYLRLPDSWVALEAMAGVPLPAAPVDPDRPIAGGGASGHAAPAREGGGGDVDEDGAVEWEEFVDSACPLPALSPAAPDREEPLGEFVDSLWQDDVPGASW